MSSCCSQNNCHCIYHTTVSGQRIKLKRNKEGNMQSSFCLYLYRETCIRYMDSCSNNDQTPFSLLSTVILYTCCHFLLLFLLYYQKTYI